MHRSFTLFLPMLAATLAAVCATATPADAAAICGQGTYAYAGFDGRVPVTGVSATISQAGPLAVYRGHVAGWIGVVDPKTDEAWLQAGLSALPGKTSAIYYEFAAPGHAPVYHQLRVDVAAGEPHRFAILEQPGSASSWVVWVDGRAVTAPIHLPGSHQHWVVQALGESWAGNASGTCNAYAYAFTHLRLTPARRRTPAGAAGTFYTDPNYALLHTSPAGFVAASIGLGGFRSAEAQPATGTPAHTPAASHPPQQTHTQ